MFWIGDSKIANPVVVLITLVQQRDEVKRIRKTRHYTSRLLEP
jgi:hypothetical protein